MTEHGDHHTTSISCSARLQLLFYFFCCYFYDDSCRDEQLSDGRRVVDPPAVFLTLTLKIGCRHHAAENTGHYVEMFLWTGWMYFRSPALGAERRLLIGHVSLVWDQICPEVFGPELLIYNLFICLLWMFVCKCWSFRFISWQPLVHTFNILLFVL